MKKRIFLKLFCIFFIFIFSFSVLPVFASADTSYSFDAINETNVTNDLAKFGIDITEYPKNVTATHGQMLYFLEYGYDYSGQTSDYDLYVYFYNPSGREVYSSGKNYITLAPKMTEGTTVTTWSNYPLEVCSYSSEVGYEHVFYKFRVKNLTASFLSQLSRDCRYYEIIELEIHFLDELNAQSFGVSGVYAFSGFMPYHDAGRTAKNTLWQDVTDRLSVDLELYSTTWKTLTSDKGEGYAYEVFSVYFAVPNDIIERYGDKEDATKGLIEVDGTYEEYKVNGLVTPYGDLYNTILPYLSEPASTVPFGFATGLDRGTMGTSIVYSEYNFNYDYSTSSKNLDRLCMVLFETENDFEEFSDKEFYEAYCDLVKQHNGSDLVLSYVDEGATRGHQDYKVKVTDDLSVDIATYATTHRSGVLAFLRGEYNLYRESKNENYGKIGGIEAIESSDVNTKLYNRETIANRLFIDEADVDALHDFVERSNKEDKTVYIIRFAARDYYCAPAAFVKYNSGNNIFDNESYDENDGNCYFEKTIFRNFDILTLTYENAFSQKTVLPVVASPIDAFGSVTPTIPPSISGVIAEKLDDGFDFLKTIGSFLGQFKLWISVILVLIVVALVSWILSKLGFSLSGVFRGIGKLIAAPFKLIDSSIERKKRLDDIKYRKKEERRKATEHIWNGEDHADDRKYRFDDNMRKNEEHIWKREDHADNRKYRSEDNIRKNEEHIWAYEEKLWRKKHEEKKFENDVRERSHRRSMDRSGLQLRVNEDIRRQENHDYIKKKRGE